MSRKDLDADDYALIAAAVFFGFVALGGINLALWQHNPGHEWEAVCWFNGFVTSWAFPALITATYCAIQDVHLAQEKRRREQEAEDTRLALASQVAAREQAHWDSLTKDERTAMLQKNRPWGTNPYRDND